MEVRWRGVVAYNDGIGNIWFSQGMLESVHESIGCVSRWLFLLWPLSFIV